MVDHPEIKTNEDFEYIVQAERINEDKMMSQWENDVEMADLSIEPKNEVPSERFNIPESSLTKSEVSTNKSHMSEVVKEVLSPESKKQTFFESAMKTVRKTFQKQEKRNKSEKKTESKNRSAKVGKNVKDIKIIS